MTDATRSSRRSGWNKLTPSERVKELAEWLDADPNDLRSLFEGGGLDAAAADALVENVCGRYALPFSVAPNFTIDGRDVWIPMVVEEPSVVAACSNAARMVREGGGFRAEADDPIMICQIQLFCDDLAKAREAILENKARLLDIAGKQDEALARNGGGPRDLEAREMRDPETDENFLVVHLLVDVRDAMGANAVNTMGEAIAPEIEKLTGGVYGLRILTNLADRRLVRVSFECPAEALALKGYPAEQVVDGVVSASRFAELDPYRAATHNKGIMNGVDPVLVATGNDWRAVEAGAHAYAAKSGRYKPLSVFRKNAEGRLTGRLEMPMAVGVVGGATRAHPAARLALEIMGVKTARDLAILAATAGLATNLASLRALSTEGIQKGHMRLHQRSRHLQK
ncbi:MAG: hydroxymethylglutaryl-CoA reductase, degradative [Myxococcales bacterium]|nr:MAG: hydroxymethylglutaryl-CoA reductase, degradative [Myxococcales bacterium]